MTKIIGLTGGIGSGKTTVAAMFEKMGMPIFIADDEALRISTYPEIVEQIIATFGEKILTTQQIDRKKLASLVFNNSLNLQKLNNIIHPAVKKSFELWCEKQKKHQYVLYESAILFETNSDIFCYKTITVSAPEKSRIERVMHRNGLTEKDIKARIDMQWSDWQRAEKADYVIENIELKITEKRVKYIFESLQNLK